MKGKTAGINLLKDAQACSLLGFSPLLTSKIKRGKIFKNIRNSWLSTARSSEANMRDTETETEVINALRTAFYYWNSRVRDDG